MDCKGMLLRYSLLLIMQDNKFFFLVVFVGFKAIGSSQFRGHGLTRGPTFL